MCAFLCAYGRTGDSFKIEKSKVKLVNLEHVYRIIYLWMTLVKGMLPNPAATPDHRFIPGGHVLLAGLPGGSHALGGHVLPAGLPGGNHARDYLAGATHLTCSYY
jgi:hypothetical protein